MSRRGLTAWVGGVLAHPLLCAAGAWAAEEAEHSDSGTPFGTLFFSTVNLALFLWILGRYVMPPVRAWVANRRAQVVSALHAAATAKAEAERLREEWARRVAEIEPTIARLRAQALEDTERERTRILDAARKTAETIRRDAERAAAYEIRRTQEQLRRGLVLQALQLAEERARQQWSAADQERFVGAFLKQVAK